MGEAYRNGLPRETAGLEPLPLLLALNQRCAAAEGEGRTVVGPGLPMFCAGDARFESGDCLTMEKPDHTFTAGMRYAGHTDLPGDGILDHHERLEIAAAIDREIDRDDA